MKKETKIIIVQLGILILMITFMFFIMFLFLYFIDKIECNNLSNEGYLTKFSFKSLCEIKIEQTDGSIIWMKYSNLGNDFTLQNYGVKK